MVDIIQRHRAELDKLCRQYRVRQLELFGSAATDGFDPIASDLDFLVEFQPLTPVERADAYFGLLHALEDLFRRKIDLVAMRTDANPWFQRAVQSQRTVLYAA